MNGVFVTAIGTDCGKTHVSAAIVRELVAQQRAPMALKPLMSGFSPDALDQSDAGRLLVAMERPATTQTIADICWKSFTEWAAPNVAARRAGVELDYAELWAFVRTRLEQHQGPSLIEGAGGVMSPLTDTHTNLDLAADLGLPVMLLSMNYLGAVSHTLTALEVLAARGLSTKAIVVTQPTRDALPTGPFVEELSRWTQIPLVAAPFAHADDDNRRVTADLVGRLFP